MSRLLLPLLATLALALTLVYFSLWDSTPTISNSPFNEHRALSTTRDLSTRFPSRHVSSMDSVRTGGELAGGRAQRAHPTGPLGSRSSPAIPPHSSPPGGLAAHREHHARLRGGLAALAALAGLAALAPPPHPTPPPRHSLDPPSNTPPLSSRRTPPCTSNACWTT